MQYFDDYPSYRDVYYRQCKLQKNEGNGIIELTTWINDKFATVDKIISVEETKGNWTTGWKVTSVGKTKLPERQVIKARDLYRYQRQASDI